MTVPRHVAFIVLGLALLSSACGSESKADTASTASTASTTITANTTASTTSDPSTVDVAPSTPVTVARAVPDEVVESAGRVVVVAEEGVVANLLALGIPVVAASPTVPDAGFLGMGDLDASGIEVFDYLTLSLEQLAAYRPDVVVTWQFMVDQVGEDALSGVTGDLLILPDGSSQSEVLEQVGARFGREAEAAAMIAELDAKIAAAAARVPDDCAVSVATIYAGPSVAAFVAPVWDLPKILVALGCELVPDSGQASPDRNGRAWISLEQVGLLSAPHLMLMQTDAVAGEAEAIEEVTNQALWQQIPAVAAGDVSMIDRLGYAGVSGEFRLIDTLVDILA